MPKYKNQRYYAVYTRNDELIFVGMVHEIEKLLNYGHNSLLSEISRFKKGINTKYKYYLIEED